MYYGCTKCGFRVPADMDGVALMRAHVEEQHAPQLPGIGDEYRSPDPTARHTDPATSHAAARAVRPGNDVLTAAIRRIVAAQGPLTAFEIADRILAGTNRWQPDTIRTACKRAGLDKKPGGTSPGGRECCIYFLSE